jgi:hypothetical protein
MELRDIKNSWLDSKTQVLDVDDNGILLGSCNTLFNADSWISRPLGDFFHLAASTFPYWDDWHEHNWIYQGVELQIDTYNGLVDVYLEKHPKKMNHWLVFVIDHSDSYRKFQKIQTKRNLKQM